jgi:hypothetical protein
MQASQSISQARDRATLAGAIAQPRTSLGASPLRRHRLTEARPIHTALCEPARSGGLTGSAWLRSGATSSPRRRPLPVPASIAQGRAASAQSHRPGAIQQPLPGVGRHAGAASSTLARSRRGRTLARLQAGSPVVRCRHSRKLRRAASSTLVRPRWTCMSLLMPARSRQRSLAHASIGHQMRCPPAAAARRRAPCRRRLEHARPFSPGPEAGSASSTLVRSRWPCMSLLMPAPSRRRSPAP